MRVYINPGHDVSHDSGAVNSDTGMREADVALTIGSLVSKYLQAAGCETMMRQSDNLNWDSDYEDRQNAAVCPEANAWGADWYLALHSNATGRTNRTVRGVSAHIYARGGKAEKLAKLILEEAAKLSPVRTRGVQTNNFYEVRKTKMPAVLTENDFHDHPEGARWIKANHRTIAIWHARAICRIAGGLDKLERYLSGSTPNPKPAPAPSLPVNIPGSFVVVVTADALNVRYAPTTSSRIVTVVKKGEAFTIVERTADGKWGKLKSGLGWIHLGYTRKTS